MVSDTELMEEIDARLAAVADAQFLLIHRYREQIEAAADIETLNAVAEPLDRSARSIRLTYALRVKLRKDVRSLQHEATRIAEAKAAQRVRDRDDRIRDRVQTLTWREADWEQGDELVDELDRVLDYERLDPAFETLGLEQQAARIIQRLGLKAAPYPPPKGEEDREALEGASAPAFDSSA